MTVESKSKGPRVLPNSKRVSDVSVPTYRRTPAYITPRRKDKVLNDTNVLRMSCVAIAAGHALI